MAPCPDATMTTAGYMTFTVLLVASCFGCGTRNDGAVVRTIPGTEQVCATGFSISVSPDESWLVFTEWKLPRAVVFKELSPYEYQMRIATLNLNTGEIVRHSIDSLSTTGLLFLPSDISGRRQAEFEIVENKFRPPGWIDGQFYFQRYSTAAYLAIDPSQPEIRSVSRPDSPGTCSDCPPVLLGFPTFDHVGNRWLDSPPIRIEFRNRLWDPLSKEVSIAFRDSTVRAVYFLGDRPYETHLIYRFRGLGAKELVIDAKTGKTTVSESKESPAEIERREGVKLTVRSVRVTRDERYLAYVVYYVKQSFLSSGHDELFIMDLGTGSLKRVAKHLFIGNVIWSPEGDRLYYAGAQYVSDAAVRVVDVPSTFSR